ncbi:hypothetical protein GLOIN_2v1790876 [Rhizophagus irregularis DAOM 181602=DAOM 197198]|nr:hypothetical protein GLOIN_2v1790876 [Rhizophagus irregularis DAOM 181602=DAOM 197198]
MVIYLHEKFYRSNTTQLLESDIKEIRELRDKIPNASKKMAEKFHILALDKTEQIFKVVSEVSFIFLLATEIPKKIVKKRRLK